MAYSTKQKLFAEFMLRRIGFTEPKHIEQYLTQLENVFSSWDEWTNNQGYSNLTYSVSNCIKMLVDEIELKKNKQQIQVKEQNETTISATDLSNYVYCPISYSIGKSFVIDKPTGQESTINGENLHEQLKLVGKKPPYNFTENQAHESNVFQDETIRKIRRSEIIFIGHSESNHYFRNEDSQFVGQPDYIFKDEDGKYFIVEEKFHSIKPQSHNYWTNHPNQYFNLTSKFFENHKIQVISYLRNIKEYKPSYAYLIYWYYYTSKVVRDNTTYGAFPQIHDVRTSRIILNLENEKFYQDTITNIRSLQNERTQAFKYDDISINKCVGCTVNKYCSHKDRRHNTFSFPYKREDIKLVFADFPDELKKQKL